ncbi:RagB/SusD family nutrient uptake outer membrane protein [Parabacteroides sp. OttesenSCG-928-N08]|nr:RagB/SusD family nutrient uptake outer membrane protein [Parabacteroides sp. OttesenSCG-928-N08]
MKRNTFKTILFALSVSLTMSFTSCVGDLDVKPIDPSVTQEFDQDAVFAKIYATMALTGQQGPDGNGDLDGIDEGTSAFFRLIFTINEYPSDEVICSWGDEGIPELNYINWGSSHGQLMGLYARLNFDVTLCNHFLEMTEGMTDEKSVRQRAEARFMRALNFYYLMDIYGNVPFSEKVTSDLPDQIQRADLFAYIEKELKEIEADMYEPRQAPYGRADKAATWLLLSRMYLNAEVYAGTARWADAIAYSQKVIDSAYELAPVYQHLFMADNDGSSVNKANQEIILPIRQDGVKIRSWGCGLYLIASMHTEGMTFWGTTEGWGGVRARAALTKKFFRDGNVPSGDEAALTKAAGDDRALFFSVDRTVDITNVNTFKEGLSIGKFSNIRADKANTNDPLYTDMDVPFMRMAEAYLNLAEATLRNGGDQSVALNAVNQLRKRANASQLATITLDGLLDERSREFYAEGYRRMDLIRYGYFTSNSYVWDWKGGTPKGTGVASFFNLCPIPIGDLNANEKLVQNPGY